MRATSKGGKLLLATVATVLSLGVAELLLRVHYSLTRPANLRDLADARPGPAPGSTVSLGEMIQPSPDPKIIYSLRPDLDVVFQGVPVQTNARGWRGRDYAFEKPEGTVRILAIGDSVMFGWGVGERQRYTQRLESLLSRRFPEVRWEVVTLAAPGYSLAMELQVLQEEGLRYEPDLILYGYVANDSCLPSFVSEEFDIYGAESLLWQRIRGEARSTPRLVDRVSAVQGELRQTDFVTRLCTPESVDPAYAGLVGEQNFQVALEKLANLGAQHGIPVVLVAHPLRDEFAWPSIPAGIEVVYGTGVPGSLGSMNLPPQLRLGTRDHHPNVRGHNLIARNILAGLSRNNLWQRLAEGQE